MSNYCLLFFVILFFVGTIWGYNTPPEEIRPAILIILSVIGAATCLAPVSKDTPL